PVSAGRKFLLANSSEDRERHWYNTHLGALGPLSKGRDSSCVLLTLLFLSLGRFATQLKATITSRFPCRPFSSCLALEEGPSLTSPSSVSGRARSRTGSCADLDITIQSYPVIWRPWIPCHRKTGCLDKFDQGNVSSRTRKMSKGAHGFQHPVRLFMPKSRTEEYVSHLGKKVLDSFPVQATLHFYNDDSSSEEEDDEDMEEELEVNSHSLDHRSHPLRENSER
uniref:Protein ripply3 n=1 Tax=Hucho hucho TaxID=62062 RepID=A0A4W5NU12_9TELE